MVNAIQELSYAADGKYLISLSRTICSFLLSFYKDDGIAQALIFLPPSLTPPPTPPREDNWFLTLIPRL